MHTDTQQVILYYVICNVLHWTDRNGKTELTYFNLSSRNTVLYASQNSDT